MMWANQTKLLMNKILREYYTGTIGMGREISMDKRLQLIFATQKAVGSIITDLPGRRK